MKTFFASIFALTMMMLATPACAENLKHTFTWKQPHDVATTLTVPMRGGLLLVDAKRAPDETQWLRFRLKVNDYFETWPQDHIFILLDGYFNFSPNPAVPYAARGIILDRHGVYIENFVNQQLTGFKPVAWVPGRTYEIIVHANSAGVAGWVAEIIWHNWFGELRHELVYTAAYLPDQTPAQRVSLIVIGALSDFTANPPGTRSRLEVSRIEHGRFIVTRPPS
ncbi:MAG: hypothetical protein JNM76_14530 [Betaproteobacteria bacterium]|nr:hypothetical protein [Betaproteobacteria bacterium]